MKRWIFSILVVFVCLPLWAQMSTHVTHYSVDNGLSENHVLCMLQDKKGMMWFGTFDGLNSFDGYTFRQFRGRDNQKYKLLNYRVDQIEQDSKGYIWLLTNDNRFYRFNPSTEDFLPLPQSEKEFENFKKPLTQINILPDCTVWLSNNETGLSDCFRVINCNKTNQLKLTHFTLPHHIEYTNTISKIYLDKKGNTWLLTSSGAYLSVKNSNSLTQILSDKQFGAFFSIFESDTEFLLGGENGSIRVMDKNRHLKQTIQLNNSINIVDFKQINNNDILAIGNKSVFYIINLQSKSVNEIYCNELNNCTVSGSYKDRTGNIWIYSNNTGALLFESDSKTFRYLPVDTTGYVNRQIVNPAVSEDNQNNIWILTHKGGFYKYNKIEKKLETIPAQGDDKVSITNLNYQGISDRQGNLWLNTYLQGVDKIVFRRSPFTFTKPVDDLYYNSHNDIRTLFEDSQKRLWVGSKRGYVYIYNSDLKLLGFLGLDGKLNSKTPFDSQVYSMCEDHRGTIWLGTKKKGLYRLEHPLTSTAKLVNFVHKPADTYSLSNNSVYSIFEDHKNRLWIGSFGGGINLLDNTEGNIRFINHKNEMTNYPVQEGYRVRFITEDKNRNLLVGTTQGLLIVDHRGVNSRNYSYKLFVHNSANQFSMPGNDVHYIYEDKTGDIYISTIGGGVCVIKGGIKKVENIQFVPLKSSDNRFINSVYTIKTDSKANLWMSTETQLLQFNPVTSKLDVFKPITSRNYFFDEASACQTSKGELMYGTSNGFVVFKPGTIYKSNFIPQICFTQFRLFNKTVYVGDADSLLNKTIDQTEQLTLTSAQNTFSIEFAAIDHLNPEAIQYAYKMDGLEKDWNYVENQRTATYINFPKGTYTFRVKSTNADGEWVNNEKSIVIVKKPSFWESVWGLIFYVILFIALAVIVAYILVVIYKLRSNIDIEQRITNMKLRFFTDVSHELRTPLTLIASPVDNLLKKETLSDNAKEQLQMVQRNTNRMLRLINQILDFRKIQNKKMKLMVEVIQIADFLNDIKLNFKQASDNMNIQLQINDYSKNAQLCVDKDKTEKIFFNLISNAYKFSDSKKKIDITINDDPQSVTITVKDEGAGISKEKMKLLFNRFESSTLANNLSFQASTGIGLSLTKELVELQKGTIEVESEVGKGSAFIVRFLKGVEHFDQDVEFIMNDLENNQTNLDNQGLIKTADKKSVKFEDSNFESIIKSHKILIVEDNIELRAFLKIALISTYNVLEAENGKIALSTALKHSPDIIVSDIMMPDMDGLTLTQKLKSDINLSHIPIILLTAKSDIESKLEAMEYGADDYITKPFNMTYLEARIENLLKIRSQLRERFKSSLTAGVIELAKPEITNLDEVFIMKTLKYMESSFENSQMHIDDIAVYVGMSRTSFFKKIKSLTGLAPADFVREFRLQKALQMLDAGETNISQIAYNVGIEDTRYFRKWFKSKFGVNPSEYILHKSNKK